VAENGLRAGAAPGAPTAPHATPPATHLKATGPERFWSARRAGFALLVSVVVSAMVHYLVGPWSLLPDVSLELHDVDGDLAIPVDLLQSEPTSPPAPPMPEPAPVPAEPSSPKAADTTGPGAADAGARARDAGPKPDAAAMHDAADAADAARDAATDAHPDGPTGDAPPRDAIVDGSREGGEAGRAAGVDASVGEVGEAGAVAGNDESRQKDAGPGNGGPRDAIGMVGSAGNAQAGPQNVVLVVNMAAIRTHPIGGKLGPLIAAIPQWDDFLGGTHLDAVRDTDWILINGPSLWNTERLAILVHYSAPDAIVDQAVASIAKRYVHGGPFDAGVPGVKGVLAQADRSERVFLRPQPHLVAIVPKDYAPAAAALLRHAPIKAPRPAEAFRIILHRPHDSIGIRASGIEIPASIADLRLWVVPRADGGADVYGEGDTPDPAAAAAAADDMRKIVRSLRRNILIAIASQGLLEGVELSSDGPTMRLHMPASREQVYGVVQLLAGHFLVDLQLPPLGDP
jgi:hypothetical protein